MGELATLATEERAATVAALLALGAGAPEALLRVGIRCVQAAERLLALDRDARAAVLAREVARLLQPVPVGLALVHRDWIEACLVGEGDRAREAVGGAGDLPDEARRWMQRRVLGRLVDMPGEDATGVAALARVEVVRLLDVIAALGRGALAAALVRASPGEVAAVAAALGEPHGSALVAEVAALAVQPTEHAARLAAHARGIARATSARGLMAMGVRRLAAVAAAAPGNAARQLAQRLPRDLGTALLRDVAAARDADRERPLDEAELAEIERLASNAGNRRT